MSMEDYLKIDPNSPTKEHKITKQCPDCSGDGEKLSDCCGASIKGNGDNDSSDYGICPQCRDHCSFTACETCGGTGDVELTDEDIQNLKEIAAENLYEANKSER